MEPNGDISQRLQRNYLAGFRDGISAKMVVVPDWETAYTAGYRDGSSCIGQAAERAKTYADQSVSEAEPV
jgi:hypothetical protein